MSVIVNILQKLLKFFIGKYLYVNSNFTILPFVNQVLLYI